MNQGETEASAIEEVSGSRRFFDTGTRVLVVVQLAALIIGVAFHANLFVRLGAVVVIVGLYVVIMRRWRRRVASRTEPSLRDYAVLVPLVVMLAGLNLVMPTGGVFSTLGWVLVPLVLGIGMFLITRGWRYREQRGLFCARCKYPVDESAKPKTCSECGQELDRVLATTTVYHERQPWLIAAGLLVMVLGVGGLFATILSPSRFSPYRVLPDSTLAAVAPSDPGNLALWQSIEARRLSPEVRSELIDGVLAARRGGSRSTDHSERWLTQQVAAGLLAGAQLRAFVLSYSTLELRRDDAGRSSGAVRGVVLDGVAVGSWFPPVSVFVHVMSAEVEGRAVEFRPGSLNLFDISPGIRDIKARRGEPIVLPSIEIARSSVARKLRVKALLVVADLGDAQRPPEFGPDGTLIPTASHIAAEEIELEVVIPAENAK